MKQADVQLDKVYYTYIGKDLCPVVVTGIMAAHNGRKTTFRIRREGDTVNLPKPRTAAALRQTPEKLF